jgi:hypothetical protein
MNVLIENPAIFIAHAAKTHAHAISAAVMLLRDLADVMQEHAKGGAPVEAGAVLGAVQRLDFIGNAVSTLNDDLIGALQELGFDAPFQDGSAVWRKE